MGNYTLSQWTDYTRVVTPRRKKRHQKIGKEKYLISLDKKQNELRKKMRDLPIVPLKTPYQKGWVRSFFLREDVARCSKAELFKGLLEKINTYSYSTQKTFTTTRRRRGKKVKVAKPQFLKEFTSHEWENNRQGLTMEEKVCFVQKEVWCRHRKCYTQVYTFNEPWRYVLRVKPHMITHTQLADGELESEYQHLNNLIRRRLLDGPMGRLTKCRKSSWKDCQGDKEKYRYEKVTLLQLLDQLEKDFNENKQ